MKKRYTYTFNQLKDCPGENTGRLFLDYATTIRRYGAVDLNRYYTADEGTVVADDPREACEKLYRRYNSAERPDFYTGRSMSVSDVVELWDNDCDPPSKSSWFCDSVGFRLLT